MQAHATLTSEVSRNPVAFAAPESLAAALEILAGGEVSVLAGGTDLMLHRDTGGLAPTLLSLNRIAEMKGISVIDGVLSIAALTTMSVLLQNELIAEHAPVLRQAADHFASEQIRNAATIGGNLCNASPAADLAPPLLALEAEVRLVGRHGEIASMRQLPLAEFFSGPGTTAMQPVELLSNILIPLRPDKRSCFIKSGPRPALEIAIVSGALAARVEDGRLHDVCLALGSVGPTPFRARQAEAVLEGQAIDAALIARAGEAALAEAAPIDDVRASAWYRARLIKVFLERMIEHVQAD